MTARDASAEALFRLFFGRTSVGYGVIGMSRWANSRGVAWERHALDLVEDAEGWINAVDMLIGNGRRAEVWPFVANSRVLRGVGTSAHNPGTGRVLRSFQATVAVLWDQAGPSDGALARWVRLGGQVIVRDRQYFGLLPLAEMHPLGALSSLTREVASSLEAQPLGFNRPVPMPGTAGAVFLTDVAAALSREPVSGEEIALAGLRTQPMPWVTAELSA